MDSYATSRPALGRLLNAPQRSLRQGLPGQWPTGAHGVDYLLDLRARHLRVALVVQQRFVRRPLDYAVDAVRRECGKLVLHFEPTGRLFTSTDDRERFVTKVSCGADLSVGFRGGMEFFNGGDHLLRRGVECLDLRPLLRWQVGVRRIEIGQADYSEAR